MLIYGISKENNISFIDLIGKVKSLYIEAKKQPPDSNLEREAEDLKSIFYLLGEIDTKELAPEDESAILYDQTCKECQIMGISIFNKQDVQRRKQLWQTDSSIPNFFLFSQSADRLMLCYYTRNLNRVIETPLEIVGPRVVKFSFNNAWKKINLRELKSFFEKI